MDDKMDERRVMIGIESYWMIVKLSEGIFHDIKNLLATISGLSQLSMINVESEEIRENLRTITRAAFDCRSSIDNFHGYVKGARNYEKKPEVLNAILIGVLDMIRFKISLSNIHLKLNLTSNAMINCNEYEIRQSLLNILLNAMESMEGMDGILEINTYDEDNMAIIEIIDNGVGISKEHINKIFEPYFTTKGDKGTGLGMKIVKDVLDDHGGTIKIESEKGKGTKCTILAPILDNIS